MKLLALCLDTANTRTTHAATECDEDFAVREMCNTGVPRYEPARYCLNSDPRTPHLG
jgi:hypothetical protein